MKTSQWVQTQERTKWVWGTRAMPKSTVWVAAFLAEKIPTFFGKGVVLPFKALKWEDHHSQRQKKISANHNALILFGTGDSPLKIPEIQKRKLLTDMPLIKKKKKTNNTKKGDFQHSSFCFASYVLSWALGYWGIVYSVCSKFMLGSARALLIFSYFSEITTHAVILFFQKN